MRIFYIILLTLSLNVSAYSQAIEWGIEGAANVTLIYHISSYDLYGGYTHLTRLPGWLGGTFLRWHYSEKRFIKTGLDYENRNVHSGTITLIDMNGNPVRDANISLSNSYLNWNILHFFKFSKKVSIGIGLNNHFLLFSKTHFPYSNIYIDNSGKPAATTYMNQFYRSYWLSGLITFNVDFNRFNFWSRYDLAIMSRLNKNSVYKEMENAIQVGMGYRFF